MRKIKTIDDITKDGKVEFGEGYEFVSTADEADALLMRSTDLPGYALPRHRPLWRRRQQHPRRGVRQEGRRRL